MSLRLETKKIMFERSPRVKAIDFHPINSWMVLGLYSGTISLNDYSTKSCIRTFQASIYPVRAVRFIPLKHWIIAGCDDFHLRIFNYNTMQLVKSLQAHLDFLRTIIIHPSEPYAITGADDAKIKIWNYQKDFQLIRTLPEHRHFVLALSFNPKDLTKFASASMDKTVKLWNITSEGKANLTLQGHKSSVNTIDFFKGDKPHLASGSDDRTIKIWDYQTKQCLKSIQDHSLTVTSVIFHPQLQLLISTSEDGKSIIHHCQSYKILNVFEHNLGMGWVVNVASENHNLLTFGYDEGNVIMRIGSDQPVVSISNGKILWTKSMEVFSVNLKAIDYEQLTSGEKIKLSPKQLGVIDIYPTYIKHSPNGHHFAVCNSSQFVVIKIASFKSVVLGQGRNLIWHNDSDFAVLVNDVVNLYQNFQYDSSIKIAFCPHKIFSGHLITISGSDYALLYDWNDISKPIHRFDMKIHDIWWNQDNNLYAMAMEQKLIIYLFQKQNFSLTELITISDQVTSGTFVGAIFFYMNKAGKLHYSFEGKSFFLANSDKKKFLVGSLEQQDKLFLFDKKNSIYSQHVPFALMRSLVAYFSGKNQQKPNIPEQFRDQIARCYQEFNQPQQAYKIVLDLNNKFQLAVQLGYIRQGYKIAINLQSNSKIKLIGDLSLKKGQIQLAIECYKAIDDLNSLLLIYSSLSLPLKLKQLAQKAEQLTKMNVAYSCYFLTNNPHKCIDVLLASKKYPEASLFSRTYCSSRISQCVRRWKQSLNNKIIAEKICDPNADDQDQEQSQGQKQQYQQYPIKIDPQQQNERIA